jgi:hypothetical protein
MRSLLTLFLLLLFNNSISQITWDTAKDLSRHEGGYGRFKPSFKSAIIYDGNVGFEITRVRNDLSLAWLVNNTSTKYYGVNWTCNKNYKFGLFGINAGGEIDFRFLHIGLNGLVQTDFSQVKFYIIPNAGISWWGTAGIYYGLKINMGKQDFIGNNDYVLGFKYNFTKNLFKEFKSGVDF